MAKVPMVHLKLLIKLRRKIIRGLKMLNVIRFYILRLFGLDLIFRNIKQILKARMLTEIDSRLGNKSKVTESKCRLAMIPIHLVEYRLKVYTKGCLEATEVTQTNQSLLFQFDFPIA